MQVRRNSHLNCFNSVAMGFPVGLIGVRCIAAPIYDYRGEVNYSLGVSGTTNNIKPAAMDRYLSALLSASSQISSALGYKCGRQRPEVQPPVPYGDSGREE